MQRIDAYYLYQTGYKLHKLQEIRIQWFASDPNALSKKIALTDLRSAEETLFQFLNNSVFQLQVSRQAGQELLGAVSAVIHICESCPDDEEKLTYAEYQNVLRLLQSFEPVLRAELGRMAVFLVQQKNAMDTLTLVEAGESAFPPSIGMKVPLALDDVQQAMRCIAFELPTAAAFHLHRANEIVLAHYWDSVSGEKRPDPPTMGNFLKSMEDDKLGKKEIRSALKDIKNMHRNPTIHPEKSLDSVEDAINLYGAIRSVIGFMLAEIPEPAD